MVTRTAWFLIAFSVSFQLWAADLKPQKTNPFSESFDATSLDSTKWSRYREGSHSKWQIDKGKLKGICTFKPYKGGGIKHEIPFMQKGQLTFDASITGTGYNHLSLTVKFYNLSTAFKNYGGHRWLRYFNRKWRNAAENVPKNKMTKFKIMFDTERQLVEYYVGDMDHPTLVDTDVQLAPINKNGPEYLDIGHYGLASGTMVYLVDNIRFAPLELPKTESEASAMIIRGISSSLYQLDEVCKMLGVSNPTEHTVLSKLAIKPSNRFVLDRMPSVLVPKRPATIILVDVPIGPGQPGKTIPDFLQKQIVKNVEEGTHLIIFGGPFTLNKGKFQNSILETILPVKLGSPWDIHCFNKPVRFDLPKGYTQTPWLKYAHKVTVKDNAKVLCSIGDQPLVVSHPYGKGLVTIFLGMPCGKFPPDKIPFWQWNEWPKFVKQMSQNAKK